MLEPGILLALGSGIFFAFYLIATRQAAQVSDPVKTLAFQCVVGALLLTPQAVAAWSTPALSDVLLFAALGALSAVSHLLSIAAFRHADASTLAPLVYLELIGAALVGYFAFGDIPGAMTLAGAALIVAAGFCCSSDAKRGHRLAGRSPDRCRWRVPHCITNVETGHWHDSYHKRTAQ